MDNANLRLFISTFALIFLAELGDKTQLAAMARAAAGAHAKWTVFLGASSALVASTLIAVLFGSALTRVIPESYIKGAAGVLFIVFGVLILLHLRVPAEKAPAAAVRPSLGATLVFRAAAGFEQATVDDYRLARLRGNGIEPGADPAGEPAAVAGPGPLAKASLKTDAAILAHALEHERATARFYEELAGTSALPALRRLFERLAQEERAHAGRLEALLASA